MHGHNDRRVTTARIRSRVRIRNFPSTRNSVGRNFEVVRPNFSVYHRQPSRRFRASHIPVRNPYSRGVQSQIIRNANIRSTWPTIPVHSSEPVRRPSMLSQTTRRRLVVDTAKNPFSAAHTGNSINGIRHKNVITQTNKNPLLELLEERRPVLRDEKDAFLIRTHLIELNRLSNSELTNMDRRLQKQVNYIEGILDTDIRREVLKLFVKDIVEKSGFLDMDPNRVRISSLQLLVDKIKMITDKFTNMEKATDQTGSHETPALSGTSGSTPGPDLFQTTTVRDNARQEAILRGKISAALSVYDRSGHQLDTRVVDSNGDLRNLQTYRGRLGAGSSIFGGSDIPTSTVQSVTKGVKRGKLIFFFKFKRNCRFLMNVLMIYLTRKLFTPN